MLSVRWVQNNVMAGPVSLEFWLGEVKELAEAIVEQDPAHIWEEWNDVWLCGLCFGMPLTGFLPVLPGFGHASYVKYVNRFPVWERIFALHGGKLSRHYLTNGSNYRKRSKIRLAFQLAGLGEPDFDKLQFIEFE